MVGVDGDLPGSGPYYGGGLGFGWGASMAGASGLGFGNIGFGWEEATLQAGVWVVSTIRSGAILMHTDLIIGRLRHCPWAGWRLLHPDKTRDSDYIDRSRNGFR